MRILYLHQYFTTPDMGGGTRSFEFAKRWAAHGHDVHVITGKPLASLGLLPEGVRVFSTGTAYSSEMRPRERVGAFLHYAWRASWARAGVAPDVIYATSTPLTVGIPAMVLSRRYRVPYVFEVRDLWPEAPIQMGVIQNRTLQFALRRLEGMIYQRASHIVALSPGMVDGVLATGMSPSKVTMVPNAADLDLFMPGEVDAGFLLEKGIPAIPTVAYAGALGLANGIDVLAEAMVILHKRQAQVQVVVAGEGEMISVLEDAKRRNGLRNLWLLGRVSKWDVARLYKASVGGLVTFSAVPILQTNSPNKFFDLLAAGRPVVTNMSGWIADLVREHRIGFVARPGDAVSLADAIAEAAGSANMLEMGRAARRLAESEFSRDDLASKVERIMLQVSRVGP